MKLFKLEKENYKTILYLFGIKISKTDKYAKLNAKIEELVKKNKSLEKKISTQAEKLKYNTMILTREKNLVKWNLHKIIDRFGFEEDKECVIKQRFMYADNIYGLNIKNPKSFNEKILWLAWYYYRDKPDIIKRIFNKITFKDFVKEKLGEGYTARIIKIYDKSKDINYDELPDKFVIKSNWGGSSVHVKVVRDKSKLDIKKTNWKLDEWVAPWYGPYYYTFNKTLDIEPKLFVEEYIEDFDKEDSDYKFFCFNGEPKLFYIANNWGITNVHKLTYYNMDFENLNIQYCNYLRDKRPKIEKPALFDEMVKIARKLSEGFPFVRVDLNPARDKVYVGELTFTPGGGYGSYDPVEWDYKLGDMIDIADLIEQSKKEK